MAAALALTGPAVQAQERLAYVIGNSFGNAIAAREDAVSMSRALLSRGFDVIRREDVTPDTLRLGNRAARTVALYYSGPTRLDKGRLVLGVPETEEVQSPGWDLAETVEAFQNAGADEVLIFVQTCHDSSAAVGDLVTPTDIPGVFYAISADPLVGCVELDTQTRFTDRVLSAFSTPNLTLSQAFAAAGGAGWFRSTLRSDVVFWESQDDDIELTSRDMALLERLRPQERERMQALWASAGLMSSAAGQSTPIQRVKDDTIIFMDPVGGIEIDTAVRVAPISPIIPLQEDVVLTSLPSSTSGGAGGLRIFNPAPQSLIEAVPTAAGLPQPSIIVGRTEPLPVAFTPTEDGGTIAGQALDGIGFADRQRIRQQGDAEYVQLVNSGAFDPPAGSVATALQVELQRMRCYTGRIDGDWGRGSRASVDRFAAQLGRSVPAGDATVELFRIVALNDEIVCPQQARAATRAAAPRTQQTRSTPRAAQPARQRATNPAPAAPAQPQRINPATLGTGVFR